jgi:lysophospholipid acyltransferase (LPLAT)-like uncharacterized protein
MKIRNRHLIRLGGWAGTRIANGLVRSLRFQYHTLGYNFDPATRTSGQRSLAAIWHEHLLLPAARFGGPDLAAIVSQHADGQILASLLKSKGMQLVLGSTSRGGVEALRNMTRAETTWQHLVFTPDGPRGPRRVVQQGIIYTAARTGLPIVPVGIGLSSCWRLKSWDRFAIPKPFSRGRILTGAWIHVPPEARREKLEAYRLIVQNEMDRMTALAQQWAETDQLPEFGREAEQLKRAS